jgi:hypothetical protein
MANPIPTPGGKGEKRKDVAIFGAGIAGLTAAHELVERGYRVEVFEPAPPSLEEETCSVGGMARTQWARAPQYDDSFADLMTAMVPTRRLDLRAENTISDPIPFAVGSADVSTDVEPRLMVIACILNSKGYEDLDVDIRGFDYLDHPPSKPDGTDCTTADCLRALNVRSKLKDYGVRENRMYYAGLGLGHPDDWRRTREERCHVVITPRQSYVPGEHGFRFFPTFYRNVRDTMKRTPVAEDGEAFVETARTVFDNLVTTKRQAINLNPPRDSYVMPREPVTSVQEAWDTLVDSLKASGFTLDDIERFGVKLFKYMTSCPARREKYYEHCSWWDFVDGGSYSPLFQTYLQSTPQTLVAMNAKECDARTFGNITVQLLRDNVLAGEATDATLNGPTSSAWFHPWRRYLESQGVVFRRGQLVEFQYTDDEQTIWPVVLLDDDIDDPSGKPKVVIVRDFYVVALSIEGIYPLVRNSPHPMGDFKRIYDLALGQPADDPPTGILRNLSGIQYYFATPVRFLRGHIVYADASWGLSSIAQPQFWMRRRGWWDAFRGLLTVGIGNWHEPELADGNGPPGKKAWQSTRQEIAESVWRQIVRTLRKKDGHRIPKPVLYHVDDNIRFCAAGGLPSDNLSRMMINPPGEYANRPGKPYEYECSYKNLVLAGSYMQTQTRLTTMEAANESGRHAVNAILAADRDYYGELCEIAAPEENEFSDLEYFRDLDKALLQANLPHFIDILEPPRVLSAWLRGEFDIGSLDAVLRRSAKQ